MIASYACIYPSYPDSCPANWPLYTGYLQQLPACSVQREGDSLWQWNLGRSQATDDHLTPLDYIHLVVLGVGVGGEHVGILSLSPYYNSISFENYQTNYPLYSETL